MDLQTCKPLIVLLPAILAAGCGPQVATDSHPPVAAAPISAEAPAVDPYADAIDAGVGYLHRHIQPDGAFVYRINLHPEIEPPESYNLLRHAGALYALALYAERAGDADLATDLLAPAAYLNSEIVPLPDRADTRAVLTRLRPGSSQLVDEMKLGGSALAIVALVQLDRARPGSVDPELLRSLARFVLMMQEPDGRFRSKFYPDFASFETEWVSLYYPGEAAMGLAMLAEHVSDPNYSEAAADALAYLARSRAELPTEQIPPDHWALMATAELAPLYDGPNPPTAPRELLVAHAIQVSEAILARAAAWPAGHRLEGSILEDGRTTPTATMVEGLLAARTVVPAERAELRRRIDEQIDASLAFLLRSQIRGGLIDGAIPRRMLPESGRPETPRGGEVRIDYVQHAICAMMEYRRQQRPGQAEGRNP